MASRFSTADVAALSRDQMLEALGIALRMKAVHARHEDGDSVLSDQECLDAALDYELNPTASAPQARFKLEIGWVDEDALNPYRWRSRSWLYRFWKTDPVPASADFYPIRRARLWTLDPDWEVPWPHEPGRPDLPLGTGTLG